MSRASEQNPVDAGAMHSRAIELAQNQHLDEAIEMMRHAIAIDPNSPVFHSNLGLMLLGVGRVDESIAAIRAALSLRPDYAEAHNNLGNALVGKLQFKEATAAYEKAVKLKPDYAQAYSNLSNALRESGRTGDAIAAAREALALRANYPEARFNLGVALETAEQLDDALAAYRMAVTLRPDFAQAHNAMGNVFKKMGMLDEAISAYSRAVELSTGDVQPLSNLAMMVHFHPDYDVNAILRIQRRWNDAFARPLAREILPHSNNPNPDRKLKIGYISPDFRAHSVGRFLLPLFANHNPQQFEIFCYADVSRPDDVTWRLRGAASVWRDIQGISDAEIASRIRRDRIDILVDLSLQTAGNRLLVFAREPAPVQVTYLSYCSTSGLDAMDFRLSDPYLDPPSTNSEQASTDEPYYQEKTIRLTHSYWCYEAPEGTPPVNPLPATGNDFVTFGCFNTYAKVSSATWQVWHRLLKTIPDSRLIVHAALGSHREMAKKNLAAAGVNPDRLSFVTGVSTQEYFKWYEQIDIALDPFPYGGGTTNCDAIWMGVPVVTLRGRTGVGRGGASILSNLGMTDWISNDEEHYIQIAGALANDRSKLAELRRGLRQRMQNSPLMDGPSYARDVEAAYRRMWRQWGAKRA
jgi:protein O-GlcNAc transferase